MLRVDPLGLEVWKGNLELRRQFSEVSISRFVFRNMTDITCFQQALQMHNDLFYLMECFVYYIFLFFYGSQVLIVHVVYF